MTKSNANIDVFRRAVELARSGEFESWKGIEQRLLQHGFEHAPQLLDAAEIRTVLDNQCRSSKADAID